MKKITDEEVFIAVISRINRYFIIMSVFFLLYFLLKTKVDVFLFLLALSYMAFALLSHKHFLITDRLFTELQRAKTALDDVSKDMRDFHPGSNA